VHEWNRSSGHPVLAACLGPHACELRQPSQMEAEHHRHQSQLGVDGVDVAHARRLARTGPQWLRRSMTTAAYLRVSTGQQSIDQQHDAIAAAGITPDRVFTDSGPRPVYFVMCSNSDCKAWRLPRR
jgi:hypothetical protein